MKRFQLLLFCSIQAFLAGTVSGQSDVIGFSNEKAAAASIVKKSMLVDKNLKQIFVRPFIVEGGTSNRSLPLEIIKAFDALEVTHVRGAEAEMSGRISRITKNGKLDACRITITLTGTTTGEFDQSVAIVNRSGHPIIEANIAEDNAARTLVGGTETHVTAPDNQKAAEIKPSIVRPEEKSPYGVEFLVKKDGKYVVADVVRNAAGILTTKVRRGDVVGLRVRNDTNSDVGVDVRIDGVSRFALSQEVHGLDLVPAGGRRLIKGYQLNLKTSAEFRVGAYEESVASRLEFDDAESVGTFTVAFRHVWSDPKKSAAGEPGGDFSTIGISAGGDFHDPITMTPMTVGVTRATVKITYEELH